MADYFKLPDGRIVPASDVRQDEMGRWMVAGDGGWLPVIGSDGNWGTPVASGAPGENALWQQLGMNSVQRDRLKAMGLSDDEIGSRLQAYMKQTGATQADPMNWGDQAMNRAMGFASDPALESAQQKFIALTQQKNQALNGQTDYGFLPMAASMMAGGTLTPWLSGVLGGGAVGGLGASAITSGLTSGLFGGDPVSAAGRSLLMGGLNQATGGIGNILKTGSEAAPDWMKGFYSGAQNINSGTQVAGGTGGAGLGGGMFEDIPWGMTSVADAGGSSPLTYSYPGWDMSPDMGDPNSIPWGMTSAADAGGISKLGGSVSGWDTPMSVDWSNPSNWGQALGISGAAAKMLFGGGGGSSGGGGIGSLLGMGLGGLLGGMSANSKPAGTVTSITDIPDWQKQYAQYTQQMATNQLGQQSQDPRLTQAGNNEMLKTVQGGYLNSNPYLDATYKQAADQVGAGIDSRFSAAGRYGSGAHQGVLGKSLGDLATNIYGGNYQAERGRQASMATGVPSYQTAQTSAQFAPLNQYRGLTTGYGGGSQTNPYFSNTAGGILSGALAGSQFGRMF